MLIDANGKFKFCFFWNFFPLNIFDLKLVEPAEVGPVDMEG